MLPAVYTWTLTGISVAAGLALLWAFGRFSNQRRIAAAKGKVRANLYAFRLFADEPGLVWRAQKRLLLWNARYIGLMLRPTLVVLLPMAGLLYWLDGVYGTRPLNAGEVAIASAPDSQSALAAQYVTVETPPVRIPGERRVYWRIRANAPGRPALNARIEYPPAQVAVFGAGVHWLLWFSIVSLATMLAFRKRFGVTF